MVTVLLEYLTDCSIRLSQYCLFVVFLWGDGTCAPTWFATGTVQVCNAASTKVLHAKKIFTLVAMNVSVCPNNTCHVIILNVFTKEIYIHYRKLAN